jgi:hypothetical protein
MICRCSINDKSLTIARFLVAVACILDNSFTVGWKNVHVNVSEF